MTVFFVPKEQKPMPSPFEQMQSAVDVVNDSQHPTNKIAATLSGAGFSISKTNYWPEPILSHFGTTIDIGNSSGTLHAEIACILSAASAGFATDGATLYGTDPPCPNCAKNIAEAGIKTVYIDHKGFDKDFAARRGAQFEDMSMQIFQRAGITVFEIRRKKALLTPILTIDPGYAPPNDAPVIVSILDQMHEAVFLDMIADARANFRGEKFALSFGAAPDQSHTALCARAHLAIGYTMRQDAPELHDPHGKYTFILEPVNRILMNAARLGYRVDGDWLYSSTVPTSRELVNIVGAGITHLYLGTLTQARDDSALLAIKQLSDAGILSVKEI